jgi:hypothetical protein
MMLQLLLATIVKADREREVTEDLRKRQSLLQLREQHPPASPQSHAAAVRRGSVRARATGA